MYRKTNGVQTELQKDIQKGRVSYRGASLQKMSWFPLERKMDVGTLECWKKRFQKKLFFP